MVSLVLEEVLGFIRSEESSEMLEECFKTSRVHIMLQCYVRRFQGSLKRY